MENMMNSLSDIKKTMETTSKFHMFFDQMKAHELRQKELRDEVNQKLKNIQNSEKNIVLK